MLSALALGQTQFGNLTYSYDSAGRVTAKGGTWARTGLPAALTTTIYDAANELTKWGTANLSYDANGNVTNDGTNSYTWNARNQLVSLSGAAFQYDPFGRRQIRAGTSFLYDGSNPIQELSGQTVTANTLAGGIDEFFVRADSAGARSLLPDLLGSTVALTDNAGAVQTQYTYEPFGNTTFSGATSANPFQFTGRENDATGLYYYRARYYHPVFGRFISEDPIGFGGGGTDLYSYVFGSPTKLRDPSGRQAAAAAALAGGGLGTGFGADVATGSAGGPIGAMVAVDLALLAFDVQQATKLYHSYFPPSPAPAQPMGGGKPKTCGQKGEDGDCVLISTWTEGTNMKCWYECPRPGGGSVEKWSYSTTAKGCPEIAKESSLR